MPRVRVILIQASLPIPPFLGLAKNRRYSEMAVPIGREYNLKKPYLGLEMGGGIGREAVLCEGGIGRDDFNL